MDERTDITTEEVVAFELPFTLYGSRIFISGEQWQVQKCEQWFQDRFRETALARFKEMAGEELPTGVSDLKRRIIINESPPPSLDMGVQHCYQFGDP